jgi:hypothetical protein
MTPRAMRRLPRFAALVLAGLVAACGAHDVTDLRLDGLSRPHIVDFAPGYLRPGPDTVRLGIVADLSTSRDLRDLTSGPAGRGVSVHVVTCAGRTHVTLRETRFDAVREGDLRDDLEFVNNRQPRSDWPPAIDGRYRYTAAIVLRQPGRQQISLGVLSHSTADIDLARAPVDLCLLLQSYGGRVWRSNTVVIPADAIRAAVTAATPP